MCISLDYPDVSMVKCKKCHRLTEDVFLDKKGKCPSCTKETK